MCMFRWNMVESVTTRGYVCWKAVGKRGHGPYWVGFEGVRTRYVAASCPPTRSNKCGWYVFATKGSARRWAKYAEGCRRAVVPVMIRGHIVRGESIDGVGYRAEFIRRLRKGEVAR